MLKYNGVDMQTEPANRNDLSSNLPSIWSENETHMSILVQQCHQ